VSHSQPQVGLIWQQNGDKNVFILYSVTDRYMRRLLATGMVMYVSDMTGPANRPIWKTSRNDTFIN
jgi:hypothetical protein